MPNVRQPCPGYPSFKYLGCQDVEVANKYVQKVSFCQFLVTSTQAIAETQPEEFVKFVNQYVSSQSKEIYVGFPFQREARIVRLEDKFTVYQFYWGRNNTVTYETHNQTMDEEQWRLNVNRCIGNIEDKQKIYCPMSKVNVLCTYEQVVGAKYENGQYRKVYDDRQIKIPLSMLMRKRDMQHPLQCLTTRTSANPLREIQKDSEAVCLQFYQYGIVGKVRTIDSRKDLVLLNINKEEEERKVHDPFIGQRLITKLSKDDDDFVKSQSFFDERAIELQMGISPGIVSRITSSFIISYRDPHSSEKVAVDLGLQVKNFSQRLHVPHYVRFVANANNLANNQLDGF